MKMLTYVPKRRKIDITVGGDGTVISASAVDAAALIGLFVRAKLAAVQLKLADSNLADAKAANAQAGAIIHLVDRLGGDWIDGVSRLFVHCGISRAMETTRG